MSRPAGSRARRSTIRPGGWSALARSLAVLATLPAAACYTYYEVPPAAVAPGAQARVRLDREGFGRVANQAAMNRFPVESLDLSRQGVVGRVVDIDGTTMTMELRGVGGAVFDAEVPVRTVEELALRRLSIRRTALAGGAFVALVAMTLSADWLGGTTSPRGPPDTEDLAPGISIPVRIPFR